MHRRLTSLTPSNQNNDKVGTLIHKVGEEGGQVEKEEEQEEGEEEEGFAAGISCGRAVEIEVIFAASHRLRLAFPASDEQVRLPI